MGLICVGLVGLGFFLSIRPSSQTPSEVVAASPVLLQPTFTPSPTITPIPPTATNTPEPTSTATLVVGPTAQEASSRAQPPTETPTTDPNIPTLDPNVTPTETPTLDPNITPTDTPDVTATSTLVLRTPEAETPTPAAVAVNPPAVIPQGGGVLPVEGNSFLVWAGIGLLLLLILGLINYLRSPSSLSGE